jgi:integrase
MIEPGTLSALPVREAAVVWLNSHRRHVRPGTVRHYDCTIKALSLSFLAELKLAEIQIGHLERYQETRTAVGPQRVNHELNTLSQILARAGLWRPLADLYHPLPLPKPKTGRALSDDEQEHLFRVACCRPKWRVAYLASLVTVNTTAGPGEILGLTLGDIELGRDPEIHIRQGKNRFRDRWIPLNHVAEAAIRELIEIARTKGAERPSDYLLPHRAENGRANWDPTRPMYSWRKAWNGMRKEAAKEYPELARFRMYDLRHTVITRLLEDPAISEETVVSIAGWVSENMKKTYSHVRNRPRRDALDRLTSAKPPDRLIPKREEKAG